MLDISLLGAHLLVASAAQARSWLPSDAETGLMAWFDADDASTLTVTHVSGTNYVEQWSDKSGNENHLTQTNRIRQLSTGTRTIDGLNAVEAFGTGQRMNLTAALTHTNDVTLFWVGNHDRTPSCMIGALNSSRKWGQWSGSRYGYRIVRNATIVTPNGGWAASEGKQIQGYCKPTEELELFSGASPEPRPRRASRRRLERLEPAGEESSARKCSSFCGNNRGGGARGGRCPCFRCARISRIT